MPKAEEHQWVVRSLQKDDVPVVVDCIRTALGRVLPPGAEDRIVRLQALELESIADHLWVLWRDEAPVALLHGYVTHTLCGGFERITWLCKREPHWAEDASLLLGLPKSSARFLNHGPFSFTVAGQSARLRPPNFRL